MIYFLTAWVILMIFFGAIFMASRRREIAEFEALCQIGVESHELELTRALPATERTMEDLSYAVKAH